MSAQQQDPAGWLDSLNDRPELKQPFTRAAARLLDAVRSLPQLPADAAGGPHVSVEKDAGGGRLRIVHAGDALILSDTVPLLENAGLRVLDQAVWQLEGVLLEEFSVEAPGAGLPEGDAAERWSAAVAELLAGAAVDDSLNALLLSTGLTLRQLELLRAYAMYRAQIDQETDEEFLHATLVRHPQAAEALWNYFAARFDPAGPKDLDARRDQLTGLGDAFESTLEDVSSLKEDAGLRGLLNLIAATVRTNYWQGHDRISFKLRSADVDGLPEPRPLFEVGVNSAGMSGTHLRGGLVARGGIRWSDRPADFRSEVLGLLKTQTTKNAVIVPVGSKGGFVVRGAPAGRDEQREYVQDRYRDYVRGLLDLTDNQKDGATVPPAGVVAWDDPDPYLVVAADKGTATFSDLANATAAEYEFWLGDAFASGGTHGYDHKGVGITA
ncbi:MAG TPA: NAD-glutamate dehydrogenase domain-containing protein, partial [Deinococcales bacterium]|nr:NAD-glutamate dehydrogenase domain-containing protein [Deinococcales bacterium]